MSQSIFSNNSLLSANSVYIIPLPDRNTNSSPIDSFQSALSLPKLLTNAVGLSGVTQLEVDKGNIITAHRVDGGYALPQRGGKNSDVVFIRLVLTGPNRYIASEQLRYLSDQDEYPLMFLSRDIRLIKCQIESLKHINISERRETIVLNITLKQLKTTQNILLANLANGIIAYLLGGQLLGSESIYDGRQTSSNINVITLGLKAIF